jgi:hypothetical protein
MRSIKDHATFAEAIWFQRVWILKWFGIEEGGSAKVKSNTTWWSEHK